MKGEEEEEKESINNNNNNSRKMTMEIQSFYLFNIFRIVLLPFFSHLFLFKINLRCQVKVI